MPHIDPSVQECSVFFYSSVKSAEAGEHFGGSGFLTHVVIENCPQLSQMYAITNKHVLDGGYQVLRLNTKGGKSKPIETKRGDWTPHPKGYDVEALPLDLDPNLFKLRSVYPHCFITQEIIDSYRIGLGDDAFLVGRLVTHSGRQKNAPVVRFGNISLMADPEEPIKWNGQEHEAFLVECRSLSGFSGSPVFIETEQYYYGEAAEKLFEFGRKELQERGENPARDLTITSAPPEAKGIIKIQSSQCSFGACIFGIDCAHIPLWKPVYETKQAENQYALKDHWVEANTGIACVIPAWEIRNLLNVEGLMEQRRRDGEKYKREQEAANAAVSDASAANDMVLTKDDFESTLRKVSRKKSAQT